MSAISLINKILQKKDQILKQPKEERKRGFRSYWLMYYRYSELALGKFAYSLGELLEFSYSGKVVGGIWAGKFS